jgi:hypothetical protein
MMPLLTPLSSRETLPLTEQIVSLMKCYQQNFLGESDQSQETRSLKIPFFLEKIHFYVYYKPDLFRCNLC